MACVEGRTLADVMPTGGFPLDRLLAIAVPLADAVGTAHQHDIVHRDLKPANVMIGSHDRVTVLDFGLAKLCETAPATEATMLPARDLTGEGRIVGTVAYMSPEQAEGKHVDERSDVFSLGVLLYEMATGARPFTGDTSLSVLSAILKDSPKPLTDLNPMLPRDLSRIVRRSLVKDPDRRYQSAMDLRNDLEDLQQSALSGELHAVSSVRRAPPARFWPAATAVVTTGAVLAVGWALSRAPAALLGPVAPVMAYSRLTMQGGVALDPSISPDGKWVVYVGGASGNQDIYLQSVSGQTPINTTLSPSQRWVPLETGDEMQQLTIADDVEHWVRERTLC